jgi:hypothetical protein
MESHRDEMPLDTRWSPVKSFVLTRSKGVRHEHAVHARLADVLISLERKVIRLPDAEQEARCQDFLFDCHAAHKDTHDAEIAILTDQGTLHEVACSVAACIFACLRSHTRALMWKMCHEPSGVSDFFDSLDPQFMVHVATETTVIDQTNSRRHRILEDCAERSNGRDDASSESTVTRQRARPESEGSQGEDPEVHCNYVRAGEFTRARARLLSF